MVPIAVLLLLISTSIHGFPQTDPALRCKDHPAFKSALKPVIISSWTFPLSTIEVEAVAYLARYKGHVYTPLGKPKSKKYEGLDLFHTGNMVKISTYALHFQRPAKVYLFVDIPTASFDSSKKAALPGWKDEGWAKLVKGGEKITYGVHQTIEKRMSKYCYVFSRTTDDKGKDYVVTAQTDFIRTKLKQFDAPGSYNLLIAEKNGSPSPEVGSFKGMKIEPNSRCPDELHDIWTVKDNNRNDEDTKGVKFRTWHPQWDPCFWCAYDHEHGSSPKELMGYLPKFDYVPFKNNLQNEPERGFKGIVIRNGKYLMYYNIHNIQSSLRRVKTRFHTINIAVVNGKTKELLLDIQHKADFGFQAVRLVGGKDFKPIDAEEKAIQDAQTAKGDPLNFRSINVLDPENPNTDEFQIRNPILVGQYEQWQTLPICAKPRSQKKLLEVNFKAPNNGIKSLKEQNVETILGRKSRSTGKFFRSTGLNRAFSADRVELATKYCPEGKSGYFYTDPTGRKVLPGPGKNAVRQFAKPGFSMMIDNRFEVADRWTGLYAAGTRGFFVDHGYGIDPARN